MTASPLKCVLFDLDGTLVDTAPDLGHALNRVLDKAGRDPLPQTQMRPYASSGARGLLKLGFGIDESDAGYAELRRQFLDFYAADIAADSQLFPGISDALHALATQDISWGIVTNKPGWLTDKLLQGLEFPTQPLCIIGGDATPYPKPDPANLLLACEQIQYSPQQCLYVGDAQRDITAGQRAGMCTVAATYGYIEDGDDPESWGANWLIDQPGKLLACL